MSILTDLRQRVQRVNDGLGSGALIREALSGREGDILEMQQRQLLAGKTPDGEDIRPLYTEDLKPGGHFYTVESAKRYAAWKDTLNYPYTVSRNSLAPNLYINGKFHSELGVRLGTDTVGIAADTPYAAGIMAKYAGAFGLSAESWAAVFRERGALEALMNEVKRTIYGN